MTFWNTVKGNMLADTLIRCLPQITADQYVFNFDESDSILSEFLNRLIKKGYHIDQIVKDKEKEYVIIASK